MARGTGWHGARGGTEHVARGMWHGARGMGHGARGKNSAIVRRGGARRSGTRRSGAKRDGAGRSGTGGMGRAGARRHGMGRNGTHGGQRDRTGRDGTGRGPPRHVLTRLSPQIPSRRGQGWVQNPTKSIPAEATARPQIRLPNHSCRGPGLDPKSDSHFIPAKAPNLTRYPTLNPRHGSFLEPGIWALFCVGTGVPQQLGDTRSHTKQCPDSGRQKKTTQQDFLAYMNLPANRCNTPRARPRFLFRRFRANPFEGEGSFSKSAYAREGLTIPSPVAVQ